jgi:hypothetical protein
MTTSPPYRERTLTERQYELAIQQFSVNWMHDEFDSSTELRTRVREQFTVESAMKMLRCDFWMPGKTLQDDRVVASWPTNLWQHIRKSLRLSYKKTELRVNEIVVFPTVEIPPELTKTGDRIFLRWREVEMEPYRG